MYIRKVQSRDFPGSENAILIFCAPPSLLRDFIPTYAHDLVCRLNCLLLSGIRDLYLQPSADLALEAAA
jgi:hypothetical protein